MSPTLTHFDDQGNAHMVDVSPKETTQRTATATGSILVCPQILDAIETGTVKKGDVLGVARIAGIMGVKQTASLIPLCHTLLIQQCSLDFAVDREAGKITALCTVGCAGQTGVEMEALTGVTTALLTIYDMCKAIDKGMTLTDIHLVSKTGGKSGDFVFSHSPASDTKGKSDDFSCTHSSASDTESKSDDFSCTHSPVSDTEKISDDSTLPPHLAERDKHATATDSN